MRLNIQTENGHTVYKNRTRNPQPAAVWPGIHLPIYDNQPGVPACPTSDWQEARLLSLVIIQRVNNFCSELSRTTRTGSITDNFSNFCPGSQSNTNQRKPSMHHVGSPHFWSARLQLPRAHSSSQGTPEAFFFFSYKAFLLPCLPSSLPKRG